MAGHTHQRPEVNASFERLICKETRFWKSSGGACASAHRQQQGISSALIRRCSGFAVLAAAALALALPSLAASAPGDVVGKVTVGYQGWFACTGDGAPINSWWHWSGTFDPPTPTTLTNKVHCWPDMRQFTRGYQTAFTNFGNGQPALLFSSYDDQVVQTHFRWIADNGIDTAALQRFTPT